MNLTQLIGELRQYPTRMIVQHGFAKPHSHRGSYEQLAFEPVTDTTVGAMLEAAGDALGETYHGYKGGQYEMTGWTDVYLAKDGECGDPITVAVLEAMIRSGELAELRERLAEAQGRVAMLERTLAVHRMEPDAPPRPWRRCAVKGTWVATDDVRRLWVIRVATSRSEPAVYERVLYLDGMETKRYKTALDAMADPTWLAASTRARAVKVG